MSLDAGAAVPGGDPGAAVPPPPPVRATMLGGIPVADHLGRSELMLA